jgi:uncharacterized protein (TIGR02266 family)
MTNDERRTHPRIGVVLKVEYTRAADLLSDYVTDLGEGGLFIRTDAPFLPGRTIGLALSFPGLVRPILLEGIVRWRRPASKEHPHPGVGVELVFDDPATRAQIRDLVARARGRKVVDEPGSSGVRARPFRLLIVEDNRLLQDLLHFGVRKLHREMAAGEELLVSAAYTAGDAWKILQSEAVDVVIADHFLPGVTGSTLVRRMRTDERLATVPVLMMSVGGAATREEALAAGADVYLDKPVMMKQLLGTLRMLLSTGVRVGRAAAR